MKTSPAPTLRFMLAASLTTAGLQSLRAQAEYTADGEPTPLEEEIRWHLNRARFNTARENAVRGTNYTDVSASSGPLAPNESLTRAAQRHSEDMAKKNKFQHATVPGSAYYDATRQPEPWDRFNAEGYRNGNWLAENISAGQSSAEAAYAGWWRSSGHRRNMCNPSAREIGNGYFYRAASTYGRYYTMDLGTSGGKVFFTDTLFFDTNRDGSYDQGEGVPGVRISLRIQGVEHTAFDTSAAAGSFAIPTGGIAAGLSVQVWLTNQTSAPVQLSIPRDYTLTENLALAPAEARLLGTVVYQGSAGNAGFRQLIPSQPEIVPPLLSLTRTGDESLLSWPSQAGMQYLPQWSSDLSSWVDLGGYLNGSGGVMTHPDTTAAGTHRRFYRLIIRRP